MVRMRDVHDLRSHKLLARAAHHFTDLSVDFKDDPVYGGTDDPYRCLLEHRAQALLAFPEGSNSSSARGLGPLTLGDVNDRLPAGHIAALRIAYGRGVQRTEKR